MKMRYISRIQSGLKKQSKIATTKVSTRILDGSYNSVYKGRSMNFDELREYVAGDNIKDMDWKASARSGRLLVRQYIAEKKHDVMLVFDTNKRMLADSKDGEEKKDIAIMGGGTLGYLVNRQGDYVGSVMSTKGAVKYFPLKTNLLNLELILQEFDRAVNISNSSDVNDTLEFLIRNFKRRMIIVIVTDPEGVSKITESNLRRLLVLHDVLVISVSDTDLSGKELYDLERGNYLPDFFTKNKRLTNHMLKRQNDIKLFGDEKLKRFGVSNIVIDNITNIDSKINELLQKHKFEKR